MMKFVRETAIISSYYNYKIYCTYVLCSRKTPKVVVVGGFVVLLNEHDVKKH